MGRGWRCVVFLLVASVVGCESLLWWGTESFILCQETCYCSSQLQQTRRPGIDCRDANITNLPDELVIPSQFSSLDLSRNHLTSLSSTTFQTSSSLLSLDLSDNDLKDLPAGVFQPLQALKTLVLKNNKLNSVDKEAFSGLHSLAKLDLSYNKIRTLPQDVFEDVGNLEELSLGFNPMVELNSSLFLHTLALRTLDLNHLGILTILPNVSLMNFTKLERLSLAHNHIPVVPSKALFFLRSSLIHLDLSGNPIKTLGAYSFYGLSNVRTLVLEQMLRLETIDAYAFGDLNSLETVVLRYLPRIKSIDPKAFHGSVRGTDVALTVEDFTLAFSILPTLPEGLLPWKDLRYLNLQYNRWNCDCNMRWIKTSPLMDMDDSRMLCSQPLKLRGHRIKKLQDEDFVCGPEPLPQTLSMGFLVGLMVIGIGASLITVAVLVYQRQGWLCRRREVMYSNIERGANTIVISDEPYWDNEEFQATGSQS